MAHICIIGAGYVGLVSAACFAELGHEVICLEADAEKAEIIRSGRLPISEPGLDELWRRHCGDGRLLVTGDYEEGLGGAGFVFIAVGTPPGDNGAVDLQQVMAATISIARGVEPRSIPIVAIKSTVPVGTAEVVAETLARHVLDHTCPPVVSNPEFLREGQAIHDFLHPPRVVVGAGDAAAAEAVATLYQPLGSPIIRCDSRTAEMIKYASNAFLAAKISFINEIAELCEKLGTDVTQVAAATGLDPRIGQSYLNAGLGWGGSCLPKDMQALIWMGSSLGAPTPLLRAVVEVNERQPQLVTTKLRRVLGSLQGATIGIWGLAFKPGCDDVRDSPAVRLIRRFQSEGSFVRAYDPLAMEAAACLLPQVTYCPDAYEASRGADALVLATEWEQFRALDLARVRALARRPIILDTRNALEPRQVAEAGFLYLGIGRQSLMPQVGRWPAEPGGRDRLVLGTSQSKVPRQS